MIRTSVLAGLLLALLLAATPALAQTNNAEALPEPLAGWSAEIDRISESLQRGVRDDEALAQLREQLEKVRQNTASYVSERRSELSAIKSQLDKLGPAPKEGEQPESESAAKLRQELTAKSAEVDGAIRSAQVLETRAAQLSGQVQEQRRSLFSRQLLKRTQSPLSPTLWSGVAADSGSVLQGLYRLVSNWWSGIDRPFLFVALFAAAFVFWGALKLGCNAVINRYRMFSPDESPPFLRRAASAGGVALARAIPPVAAATALVFAISGVSMLSGPAERFAVAALKGFSIVVALFALIKTVLAPRYPRWRIFPAGDRAAWHLRWLAGGIAVIYGIDLFFAELTTLLVAPLPFTVARSFMTTVIVALLLAAMLRIPIGSEDDEELRPPSGGVLSTLGRPLLWVLVFAILCAAALGYIALARFLITQLVVSGSILILLYLMHVAIEDFSGSLSEPERRAGYWLVTKFSVGPRHQAQAAIVVSTVLHLLLFLIVAPLLLMQWGFQPEDLWTWIQGGFFGFEIGGWRISLGTIFGALLLFILGLVGTRLFQQWLDTRVLQRAHFEQGARSAIQTGIGYLGVALAAVIAVSYAGLDFSNVAIVAGALSVGIGFGLQSIVNNFVSGLILLAERRISVGDWIVVGAEEGYVRRISVRATEIETFDRNFVIVPNSELMSQSVKNWTFQHRRARITIEFGIAYDSDPDQVREVVTEIANAHPAVIDPDSTRVLFEDFGDNALIFQLRTFIADVNDLLDTRSDLRYEITRAFREAGIQIPYPQRDIHLKDIDRLEAAIAGRKTRPGAAPKAAAKAAAPAGANHRNPKPVSSGDAR